MGTRLYNLDNARNPVQRAKMEDLETRGICEFCSMTDAFVYANYWLVVKNKWPYAGTREHYVIIANKHVETFDKLSDAAYTELHQIKKDLKNLHADVVATATVERSGDVLCNGGSVQHLHVHFVLLDRQPTHAVRFKVSADPPPMLQECICHTDRHIEGEGAWHARCPVHPERPESHKVIL